MSATTPAPVAPFDLRSREYLLDPQAAVQHLYDVAPVSFYAPYNAYFVLGYDDVKATLADFETYSSHAFTCIPVPPRLRDRIPEKWEHLARRVAVNQPLNVDPPSHTMQRRQLQRSFTIKRVDDTKPDISVIADSLVDGLADRAGCDLMQEFALQLTVRVVGSMLALPEELLPGFLEWIGDVFRIVVPVDLKPEDVRAPDDELVATFDRIAATYELYHALLEERRANPGDDLASAMLTLTDDDGKPALTIDEVLGDMVGLTAAGTDTTAALITEMVRTFTRRPDQLQLVLDDPSLWESALREGLRRGGSAIHAIRVCRRDSEIAGVPIPAGSNVCLSLAAANADPSKFDDPLRFDLLRPNSGEHLTFGHGRHFCVGAPLAPPEAMIALQTLYRRLPGLRADLEQEIEFTESTLGRIHKSQRVTWNAP